MVMNYFKTGTVRYCLSLLIIFYGTGFSRVTSLNSSEESLIAVHFICQEAPFYFLNSIPAAIKLGGKVDLSFFRNQSVVFQYRYRLEIPMGASTVIDGRLVIWSSWTKNNMTEIGVPILDLEGGYKLVIEYMTSVSGEIEKSEKPFYVYRANPNMNPEIAESRTMPSPARPAAKTTSVTNKATVNQAQATDKTTAKKVQETTKTTTKQVSDTKPVIERIQIEKVPVNDKQIDLKVTISETEEVSLPTAGKVEDPGEPVIDEKGTLSVYNELLAEAIEKKDTALLIKAVKNGAGKEIRVPNGGNIFHILDNSLASQGLIPILKDRGISINDTDNYGDTPLHIAVMRADREYARSLISQGADLNVRNNLDLSPLHLAVYLNDQETVKDLIANGAQVNLQGNTGYTALHIASEMNFAETAKILLLNGAKNGIKTRQGLTPKAISVIQQNNELIDIINNKDSDNQKKVKPASGESVVQITPDMQNIRISFNLPYDKRLAEKRQFSKVIQIISVPVLLLSSSGAVYLKSEAANYYKLSKIAETEVLAKVYYDKTTRYDKNALITGSVSLVSLYGLIHSTLRKRSVSGKMYKTFY